MRVYPQIQNGDGVSIAGPMAAVEIDFRIRKATGSFESRSAARNFDCSMMFVFRVIDYV